MFNSDKCFLLIQISCLSYPSEKTSKVKEVGNLSVCSENLPFLSVAVPTLKPFTFIEAPSTGIFPVVSVTTPSSNLSLITLPFVVGYFSVSSLAFSVLLCWKVLC